MKTPRKTTKAKAVKATKTVKALNTVKAQKLAADSAVDITSVKAAIHKASSSMQTGVSKGEFAALAAAERVEEGMEVVKASIDGAKQFGNELMDVVDNAGRTALGSVVALNGSIMTYGREAINDTIETGRKSFEVKSLKDAVDLQTEFTERRLKAMFNTMGALNSLAHTNTMAMWSPLADMLRGATDKGEDAFRSQSERFTSMM